MVNNPSAWKAADWKDNQDWVYRLSQADIAELDTAVSRAVSQGIRKEASQPTCPEICCWCTPSNCCRRDYESTRKRRASLACLQSHPASCCRATTYISGMPLQQRLTSSFPPWEPSSKPSGKTCGSAGASSSSSEPSSAARPCPCWPASVSSSFGKCHQAVSQVASVSAWSGYLSTNGLQGSASGEIY